MCSFSDMSVWHFDWQEHARTNADFEKCLVHHEESVDGQHARGLQDVPSTKSNIRSRVLSHVLGTDLGIKNRSKAERQRLTFATLPSNGLHLFGPHGQECQPRSIGGKPWTT